MGFGPGLDIFRTPTIGPFRGARRSSGKIQRGQRPERTKIPPSHLAGFFAAVSKLQKIAGFLPRGDTGVRITSLESVDWENAYRSHKHRARKSPISVLEGRRGLIVDKNFDMQERLSAWYFRAAASVGLRWNGLLNKAQSTLALMGGSSLGSRRRPTRGKSLHGE